uniref:Transposase (Putative), gypsy type n=1 Tax=Tanacetum cinerariifolium TaxID=118510 RepID=A0A6L2MU23_TANCI|nr:hypothetical protein [Tanacetum cinerariifolium]
MVTSSVSATPEHESGASPDSITGLNVCTIGASERFVISSNSSHHSSTNASGAEGDSIIKSSVVPLVITEAVVTSPAVNIPLVPEMEFFDHLAPPALFSKIREMGYHHLFIEFNVGTARQACLNAEVRMKTEYFLSERKRLESECECEKQAGLLKARDDEVEKLKAQLLLKETEADLELKDLNVAVSSLRSQKDGLVDQVHALKAACSSLRDQLDADLLEMALHLKEKFYPYLLTTISGRRWLLTHGLRLAVVKCLNSQEHLSALGTAISRAIEVGMHDGLSVDIDHGKAGRNLADVVAYNPATETDYNSALQRLREVNFSLLADLKSHKDASVEDIMNILRLEGPLADDPGMSNLQPHVDQLMLPVHRFEDQVVLGETSLSFALNVTHSRVERITKNVEAKRSAFISV